MTEDQLEQETVGWLMVKRILRKYKYPPDRQVATVQLVLDQAESLSAEWG